MVNKSKRLVSFLLVMILIIFSTSIPAFAESEVPTITFFNQLPGYHDALTTFAYQYNLNHSTNVQIISIGNGDWSSYWESYEEAVSNGLKPDIIAFENSATANLPIVPADMSDQAWVNNTDYAINDNGKVVGFPLLIEGYGMIYNADLLSKAKIDPSTLTNIDAYKAAFKKIDKMKDELGIVSPVSMAAGNDFETGWDMSWVTALHNLNIYLAGGLDYQDTSVLDDFKNGVVQDRRFSQYADYVKLLFDYSDPNILLNGDFYDQVNAFANGETVFLHQGNWAQFLLQDVEFKIGIAPHGAYPTKTDGIYVSPTFWYAIDQGSPNVEIAKDFLNEMAMTEAGRSLAIDWMGSSSAFKWIQESGSESLGALHKCVSDWALSGKIYAWQQVKIDPYFAMGTLGPIYLNYANGSIASKRDFIAQFKEAVAGYVQ